MRLVSVAETYCQIGDCCSPSSAGDNVLDVKTEDGGGGPFLVLKTKRWAVGREEIALLARRLLSLLRRAERAAAEDDAREAEEEAKNAP
jgi:hypothetical protein